MASQTRSRNGNSRNGNRREQPVERSQSDYTEESGWGSAFHRPDNEAPKPTYTGTGVLDDELLKAIHDAGGEFQISVWPKRARTGTKYLRIHIEPPYEGGENAELDEDEFDGATDADPGRDSEDGYPF